MNEKTKKTMLAVGGITLGVAAAMTGSVLVGGAVAGVLLRTGVLKVKPGAAAGAAKALSSTSGIFSRAWLGTACWVSGHKMAVDSAVDLYEADRAADKIKVVVYKDPENPNFVVIEALN